MECRKKYRKPLRSYWYRTDTCKEIVLLDVGNIYILAVTIKAPTCMITVIDQIITNIPAQCYSSNAINSLFSDHYTQCITINMTTTTNRWYKEVRNALEANIKGLCSIIQNGAGVDDILHISY